MATKKIHIDWIDTAMGNSYAALLLFIVIMACQFAIIPFCRRYLPYVTAQKEWL